MRFHYGEATDADGVSSVNARGWLASLTLSFVDNYDTDARSRGARSNNDGQLLFGLAIAR